MTTYTITRTNFDWGTKEVTTLGDAIEIARGWGWECGVWEGTTLHYTYSPLCGGNARTAEARRAAQPARMVSWEGGE